MTKTEAALMEIARASHNGTVHVSHGVDCGTTGLARSRSYGDRKLTALNRLIERGDLVFVKSMDDRLDHGVQFTCVARLP